MDPAVHHPPPSPHLYSSEAARSDGFVEKISGPCVTVIIGKSPKIYSLPIALLSFHSAFFGTEIARLDAIRPDKVANKKRKLSPSGEDDAVCDKETNETTAPSNEGMFIELPDVDPGIFGLFLRFIYKNGFHNNVDTPPTLQPAAKISEQPPSMQTAAPRRKRDAAQAKKGSRTLDDSHHKYSSPCKESTPPSSAPTTLLMPPPPSPSSLLQNKWIPPSLQAWLLGQRLSAPHFMNFSITRVYQNIGNYFTLTPFMVDYIWIHTAPFTPPKSTSVSESTSKPSSGVSQEPPSSLPPTFCDVLSPSPLRTLILDVLIKYWAPQPWTPQQPCPNPHPNPAILRSSTRPKPPCPIREAWNSVFNVHQDLREGFFNVMHAGVTMQPAHAYYISLIRPPLPTPATSPNSAPATASTPASTIASTSAAATTPSTTPESTSVGLKSGPSAGVVVKNEVGDHVREDKTAM